MRQHFVGLAKLARVDDETAVVERELRDIPAQLQQTRADVEKLAALLELEKQQIAASEKTLAAQAAEQTLSQENITRSRLKGTKARNAKEADAVERELESIRRSMKDREEESAKLKVALESMRVAVDKHQSELDELRKLFEDDQREAEERIRTLEAERDQSRSRRAELEATLPKALTSRYERIRERRGNGIAWMTAGSCGACRVSLPHQSVVAVQRGEEIFQCPNCLRVLIDSSLQEQAADS